MPTPEARNPPLRAVVLLSGGVDSATTLAIARSAGFSAHALTFRYGQRHAAEVDAARRVARPLGAAGHVVRGVARRRCGGSALTADIPVPKDRDAAEIGEGIPVTYVPGIPSPISAASRSLGTGMSAVRAEPPQRRRATPRTTCPAAPRGRATRRAASTSAAWRWP